MALSSKDFKDKANQGSFLPASKRISQLIASSWLDPNAANRFIPGKTNSEVQKILANGSNKDVENLLEAAGVDMEATFGPTVVATNWNSFFGEIKEVLDIGDETGILFELPYPPRPSKEQVSDAVLEKWVEQDSCEKPFYPTDPYIPLSGS